MPLGDFERGVLRLLAANRNPDSFVGRSDGAAPGADSPRASRDVDLFHDTVESLAASVACDTEALAAPVMELLI